MPQTVIKLVLRRKQDGQFFVGGSGHDLCSNYSFSDKVGYARQYWEKGPITELLKEAEASIDEFWFTKAHQAAGPFCRENYGISKVTVSVADEIEDV